MSIQDIILRQRTYLFLMTRVRCCT